MENPLESFFPHQNCIILDGGLATELERKGANLNDPLWSAKVLLEDPALIKSVYREYLESGADIICTVTYQATIPGLIAKGLNKKEATQMISDSVKLACESIGEFWNIPDNRMNRYKPLVAASIGPYGAFLADGSEYTGDYDLSPEDLFDFHKDRFDILATSDVDILAFETIPKISEASVLLKLLAEYPGKRTWLSFNCRDENSLASGESIEGAVKAIAGCSQLIAVGINCMPPDQIAATLNTFKKYTHNRLIAYPNKGEGWVAEEKIWQEKPGIESWLSHVGEWLELGAYIIGGCCRTTPGDISKLRQKVHETSSSPQILPS